MAAGASGTAAERPTVPDPEPTDPTPAPAGWLDRGATAGLVLLVVVPVLAAGIRLAHAGWVPSSDDGYLVGRAHDVFGGALPLVGAHSLAGGSGPAVHSPGPLLYLLLAVPVRLLPLGALPVFMAVVNATVLGSCVVLARRLGGLGLAAATAVGLALLLRSFGGLSAAEVWNPAAGRAWLVLLLFTAWTVLAGRPAALPVAAFAASFATQAHLSFAPPAAVLFGLAGIAALVAAVRPPTSERHRWRPLVLAGLVLAACWALPAYQQATGHPGNVTAIRKASQVDQERGGAQLAGASLTATAFPPRFALTANRGDRAVAADVDGTTHGQALVVAATFALLLAALAEGIRRRDRVRWSGAAVALGLLVAVAVTAAQFPRDELLVAFYAFKWFGVAGLAAWLAVGLGVAGLAAPAAHRLRARRAAGVRTDRLPAFSLALVPIFLGGAAGTLAAVQLPPTDASAPTYAPARQVARAVVDATRPDGRYLVGRSGPYDPGFTSVVTLALLRAGRRPVATPSIVEALGRDHRRTRTRCDGIVVLQPAGEVVAPRSRSLAVLRIPSSDPALRRMRILLQADAPGARSC